jgi:DNA (cytosine-5)-methyltransferase 1
LKKRGKPKAIGLFAGAGGLDIGLEAAGFKIALAVERDDDCCTTLRTNHPWKVLQGDLENIAPAEILKAAGLYRRCVDLVSAGPPCQPFSKSANWSPNGLRRLDDPRANPLQNFMDFISNALPRCVLIENVEGFRGEGLHFVKSHLKKINRTHGTAYRINEAILNAADYGVPQMRRRLFVVAFRDGRKFNFPTPTHVENPVTCWDAIGRMEIKKRADLALKGRWAKLLPSIPEGSNYLWHTNRGGGEPLFGWRTRYWSFLLKLAKSQPSWTIPAQPAQNAGPFHWRNRQLRTAEMLKLQTFPRSVFVSGDRAARQRQIGNAVPPLLGEIIGRYIRASLENKELANFAPKLSIPRRSTPPKPFRVRSPNPRYLHMIGAHADHPGTGLGPGVR